MIHLRSLSTIATLVLAVVSAQTSALPETFDPTQHMAVAEVKPGMKGYGLTVYHGTKIETFDVVVVSVEKGFMPGKSVVWVRCTDDRMQHLGPVQGMSGSPIFLWPTDTPKGLMKPGRGGRMIGAFAFGYGGGKDCYAGIQPIEHMLEAGQRADDHDKTQANAPRGRTGGTHPLSLALAAIEQQRVSELHTWRLRAIAKAIEAEPYRAKPQAASRRELLVPINVGNAAHVRHLRPMLEPLGLMPLASRSGAAPVGLPPNWIEPERVKPERGGVASVPLMTGDADLAAVGTITEVLPDGTVLAFGHAFMGRGKAKLPFATGYVHFVQPSLSSSFKLGGSLLINGAMVNDETSAIVAKPNAQAAFKPAVVHVVWPDERKNRTFNYKIAESRQYTPIMAGQSVAMSIGADTELPEDASLKLNAKLKFEGGREMTIESLMPLGTSSSPMYELIGPVAALGNSPFGEIKFEGLEATATVIEKVRQTNIINAALERSTVQPGNSVAVTLKLKPYKGEPYTKRVTIKVPDDAEDGQYVLMVGGAAAYAERKMELRPYQGRIENIDQLFEYIKRISEMPSDGLYAVLSADSQPQLAVGRTPMPDLPSSRAAMIGGTLSTDKSPFIEAVEHREPLTDVIAGELKLPIVVQERPAKAGR